MKKFFAFLAAVLLPIAGLHAQSDTITETCQSTTETYQSPDNKSTEIVASDNPSKIIYRIKVDTDITIAAQRQVVKGLEEAHKENADFILLEMNTYGGAVNAADSIRSAILRCDIPTAAFVNLQAASAGALISIACDSIYMKTGSSIGAATVVDQAGNVMPDKYQSFMRGIMRSTAQATNRNPAIAEAMVDTANVLSLTPSEAISKGYCNGIRENIDEVATTLSQGAEYTVITQHFKWLDKIINFLLHPIVQSILIMMIVGGIYIEIRTPGIGMPLVIALFGAFLYFAPLFLEDMAQNWEILLFVVGLILIIVELFILPGFGIAGVTGIIAVVLSLTFAMVDNLEFFEFDGTFDAEPILKPLAIVSISAFVAVISSILIVKQLYNTRSFDSIALRQSLKEKDGFVGVQTGLEKYIGSEVRVFTDLKPSGKVTTRDGHILEAQIDHGYAAKGLIVTVVNIESGRLYCRRIDKQE